MVWHTSDNHLAWASVRESRLRSHSYVGQNTSIARTMEARVATDWTLTAASLGLLIVVPLGVWMALVGSLTSSGVYENLDPGERAAGDGLAVVGLFGALAAVIALGGLFSGSRRWATLGGCGVVAAGVAAALGVAHDGQQALASVGVILIGSLAIVAARRTV
jgi:hypothetical protein